MHMRGQEGKDQLVHVLRPSWLCPKEWLDRDHGHMYVCSLYCVISQFKFPSLI